MLLDNAKQKDNKKRKAVFLDRDGTINVEKHYLHKISDFEFLPGVLEALRLLQDMGYLLIIVTNQSGIGRGYYTENDFNLLNEWMLEFLRKNDINIGKVYYCPHHPQADVEMYRVNCICRKPRLGLYEQAIEEFNIDLTRSYAIGDKFRDCAICLESDCRGFLIANNEDQDIIEEVKAGKYQNIQYSVDLLDSARIIRRKNE